MESSTTELLKNMQKGDKRSLARLMTYVDNRHEDLLELMSTVHDLSGNAYRLGVTGPPGAGKSTLVDKLIRSYRKQGKTVGIVAIDPSSPFSGGAVLGDRIRMQDHNADEGVFIRSLGSRGAHGGLSRATRDIVHLLDAFGVDVVIVETVGVGQTELDIMSVAYTTLVVLVPESGDTIQTMKAGLMEIADLFVVNKADREGADRIFAELMALSEMHSSDWDVPVVKSVATKNEGVAEIIDTIKQHEDYLAKSPDKVKFKEQALLDECLDICQSEFTQNLKLKFEKKSSYQTIYKQVIQGKMNPYAAASKLKELIQFS
jgi:LAO/AO transport system kinase